MADSSIAILESDGTTEVEVATDLTAGIHTPKHLALQSGSWTVALSGVTVAKDSVAGASDVGIQALAVRKNFPAGITPAEGDYAPLMVDSRGALFVHPTATYSGGAQSSRAISAATTNGTSVATSAANLLSVVAMNNHATDIAYLKVYNLAAAPTVGTDTPLFTYALAPNGGGVAIAFPTGVALSNGLAYAITAGMADSDATAVAASQVTVNLTYQWSA